MKNVQVSLMLFVSLIGSGLVFAQNPMIRDQFTADPTARVFENRIYVYPSHDVNCGTDCFCMKDYLEITIINLR